jgi:hypothetical protein
VNMVRLSESYFRTSSTYVKAGRRTEPIRTMSETNHNRQSLLLYGHAEA